MAEHDKQHPLTDAQVVAQERAWQVAIIDRIAALEKRVAVLEKK